MTTLIDQNGQLRSSRDPAFTRSLGTRLFGDAFAKYAVMNLGFASIATRDTFIRIGCRPAIVSGPTAIALLHYVHDHAAATIGFDYYTTVWNHIIVANRAKFRNLLFSLTSSGHTEPQVDRLLRKRIDGRRTPLRSKVSAARRIFGGAPRQDDVATPLDRLFAGRWSLHELDREAGQTIVRKIGTSYTPLNPAWLATAVGSSLCSYANEDYGRWIAAHHHEALGSNEPLFDEVDAIVDFPTVGPVRLCYSRLTLPVAVQDNDRLILSAAISDSGIDLRSMRIYETS